MIAIFSSYVLVPLLFILISTPFLNTNVVILIASNINICTVDDVSAQTSCVISPNITTLTLADGLTRDIEFHCQCTNDNGMMINGTRWLLPNGTSAPTQDSNIPPAVLLLANPFNNSTDAGMYICSPNNMQNDPSRDTITLSAGSEYVAMLYTCIYMTVFSRSSYTHIQFQRCNSACD